MGLNQAMRRGRDGLTYVKVHREIEKVLRNSSHLGIHNVKRLLVSTELATS
jgi:hypothetical protein